ncbi:MAG TPA: DUF445 domain-containing protein [Acidimicrobiales bacterium]|nr:DUF445 domain-containing protein [Acidimicrobiales bacterium]
MTNPATNGYEEQRARLASARLRATLILAAVSALFIVLTALGYDHGALGYLQAAAEASMVGGVADWFAVTALFRRPLGLPIPHTAVIVERKDQFGDTLGRFVQENFLNAEVLSERLRTADAPRRLAVWLSDGANARRAASRGAELAVDLAEMLREEDVHETLARELDRALQSVPVARVTGRALRMATAEGRHSALLDSLLTGVDRLLTDNEAVLRDRFHQESPGWVPELVDDAVFERLLRRIRRSLHEVAVDPEHRYRLDFDAWLGDFTDRLETSSELEARVEDMKMDLLSQVELRELTSGVWADLKDLLRDQATDPQSELRLRLAAALQSAGHRLATDPALRATVEQAAQTLLTSMAEQFQADLAGLVSTTIQRWDGRETADRLELLLGRDLQFIRINGTLVGALVGLGLHGLAALIG